MDALLNSLITELRRGTLTLAVLSQLRTPQYGYSLVQLLEKSGSNRSKYFISTTSPIRKARASDE
ncbi:hypothetical protein HFP65_00425 [Bacillus sp. CB62A.1]